MEILGAFTAVLTVLAFVPQVYQTVKTRKTRDVSLGTYSTLVTTATLWTIYGIGIHKSAIYITNAIVGSLCMVMVIMKIKDRD